MGKNKSASSVAFGGIVSALAVLLMFFTGVFPFATYALPALAGLLLVVIVIDHGMKWAWSVYAAISLLAILITPDREAATMFVLFFGYYPILKAVLEQIKIRAIEHIVKFAIFNVAMVVSYLLIIYVLGIPDILEEFGELGKYGVWIMLALGNVVFILYDITISRLVAIYTRWLKPKLFKSGR